MTYAEKKENARQIAIDWQYEASEQDLSYSELAEAGDYFYRIGKRYGLLKEFRENGIPCAASDFISYRVNESSI